MKEVGGKISQIRTEEEGFIARFWKDFSYCRLHLFTGMTSPLWLSPKMNAWEESGMFMLMNTAMVDADHCMGKQIQISSLASSPCHPISRSIPKTGRLVNKEWEPLLESPPHPEYVSDIVVSLVLPPKFCEIFWGRINLNFAWTAIVSLEV